MLILVDGCGGQTDRCGAGRCNTFAVSAAYRGYADCIGDCDDSNPDVNPFQREICNAIDDDCDGTIDEGCLSAVIESLFMDHDDLAHLLQPFSSCNITFNPSARIVVLKRNEISEWPSVVRRMSAAVICTSDTWKHMPMVKE